MVNQEQRIRARAYRIWEEEGRPEGRAEVHWDMARELIAIEDNFQDTLKPAPPMAPMIERASRLKKPSRTLPVNYPQ